MGARAEILARIRAAAPGGGHQPTATTAPLPQGPAASPASAEARFERELRSLTAELHRADNDAATAETVAAVLRAQGARTVVAWPTPLIRRLVDAEPLRAAGVAWTFPEENGDAYRGAWRQACIAADAGITEVDWALADTGTLVVGSGRQQPQMASLVPRLHIAIVPSARLLADIDGLFAVLGAERTALGSCLTLISGPSRTADIEKKIVLGVHGPEILHVVLVR